MRRSPLALLESGSAIDADRERCRERFAASLTGAERHEQPYRHWLLRGVLPADLADALDALPFPAPQLLGISGSREIHNNTRRYLDQAAIAAHPVCRSVA